MNRLKNDGGLSPLGIVLAVIAHIVLLIVLYIGASWNSTPPKPVEATLWSSLPGKDVEATKPITPPKEVKKSPPVTDKEEVAKPEVKPDPKPVEVKKPTVTKPVEAPVVAKNEKAAIKLETPASKAKKEKPQKVEVTPTPEKPVKPEVKKDNSKAIKDEMARQMAAEEAERSKEVAAQKAAADAKAKADAQARAKIGRDTADYQQKVAALVRQRVNFEDPGGANLEAKFLVTFLPNYEILDEGIRLIKSSGNKSYDDAVERALHAVRKFPPPPEGVTLGRESEFSFRLR